MNEMIRALLASAKGNPVGLVMAMIALACYGGGQKLTESALEPWGTILQGLAGVLVLIAGAWVGRAKPQPPEDPPQ